MTILQEKLKAKSKEYDLLEEKASRHKQLAKALRDSEKKCRNKLEKAMGELGRLLKDDADGELLLKSILEEEAPSREQNQQEELLERIRDLEEDNMQLTKQIAESTFKLAVIFNSAQEKGGNKLVEFLQHSIGIRE